MMSAAEIFHGFRVLYGPSDWVAEMSRNQWPDKTGMGGQFAPGISDQIGRNTHP